MNGGSMDNNPSPGNKAGGLTTILEKSLGAAAKGAPRRCGGLSLRGAVTSSGFVSWIRPGYDPVSATGQIAGGAQIVVFTTGRGFGLRLKARSDDQGRHERPALRSDDR
jgi:altronate hydrolase